MGRWVNLGEGGAFHAWGSWIGHRLDYGHAVRSVRAKAHGILEGTLTVEDPTMEWKETDTPFQKVGTIRAQHQDSWDLARVQAVDEAMRFSIWEGSSVFLDRRRSANAQGPDNEELPAGFADRRCGTPARDGSQF